MPEGCIVVVGPNPAVEVTYFCHRVSLWAPNEADFRVAPGGKGTNVALVLKAIGGKPILVTCLGGVFGDFIRRKLTEAGVQCAFVKHNCEVRVSTVIYESERSEATIVRSDGDALSIEAESQFIRLASKQVVKGRTICVAGSLPKGFSDSVTKEICELANKQGCRIIIDVAGRSLPLALKASPFLVKGNILELSLRMGVDVSAALAPRRVLEMLSTGGAQNAIVTLGKDGWVAYIDGTWLRCRIEANLDGFDIGAGDAMTAGLAYGENAGYSWKDKLQFATKIAAASTYCKSAGEVAIEQIGSAPACNIEID